MAVPAKKPVPAKPLTKERTLHDEARDFLVAAKGDVALATKRMAQKALDDHAYLRRFLTETVRAGCAEAIAKAQREQRGRLWNATAPNPERARAQVIALAAGTIRSLMDFPLPGGLRLGDAGRDDVQVAAVFYGKQAKDMAGKSRWLHLIAQSLPPQKKVAEVLSLKRLEELREEVSRDDSRS